jgi:hypothetical protein
MVITVFGQPVNNPGTYRETVRFRPSSVKRTCRYLLAYTQWDSHFWLSSGDLPRSSIATKVGPTPQPSRRLPKPGPGSLRLSRSASILSSPKWSIIPAPDSPAGCEGGLCEQGIRPF